MTTNQTIDGVPRDYVLRLTPEAHSVLLGMVEHCLNVRACMGMDEGFKDFDTEEEHDFVKELRALLDAPASPSCDPAGSFDKHMQYMHENIELKRRIAELEADQPQGVPVADALSTGFYVTESGGGKYAINIGFRSMADMQAADQQLRDLLRARHAALPAPVAVMPDGYCIMPRQLTAENGAKALLLGEFKLLATMECPECCELDEPTEGCSICDGEGEYGQKHTIPWDQIKFIYSKAVAGLALKAESAKSR